MNFFGISQRPIKEKDDNNTKDTPKDLPRTLPEGKWSQLNDGDRRKTIHYYPATATTNKDDTNMLKNLILKQEESSNISSANTTTNFYAISQFILQTYFRAGINDLASLKLVDLIVDQTYPDSLTLRKLNESTSIQPYQYFNTVTRNQDISRCPIFALSIYFVIRWSHPNPPITIHNYHLISLLDSNFIDPSAMPSTDVIAQQEQQQQRQSGNKLLRSDIFEPTNDMTALVFPWLPSLKQDMLLIDRTNYKLFSLCELFEFMGKVVIQDLRYLSQHSMLLPNIVEFMNKFIPELFENEQFKADTEVSAYNNIDANDGMKAKNYDPDMEALSNAIGDGNSEANRKLLEKLMENQFASLSKKLTTENIRLSQEITQLKTDLTSVTTMCQQILQLQRQMVSGSSSTRAEGNTKLGTNIENATGSLYERAGLNSQTLNNFVQSVDESLQHQKSDYLQLAPIGTFNSNGSSYQNNIDNNQKRKLPFPNANHGSGVTNASNVPMNVGTGGGASPFSPSMNLQPDSPYSKRYRLEEKLTPSQSALDSLLSKSVPSPRVNSIGLTGTNIVGSPASNRNNSIDKKFFMNPPQYQSPGGNNIASINDGSFSRILNDLPAYKSPPKEDNLGTNNPDTPTGTTAKLPILPVDTTIAHRRQQGALKKLSERPTLPVTESTTSLPPSPDVNSSIGITQDISSHPIDEDKQVDIPKNDDEAVDITVDDAQNSGNLSDDDDDEGANSSTGVMSSEKSKKSEQPKRSGKSGKSREHLPPIKYKLSRDNKTIWDLYAEWYIGLNGQPSIRKLIEDYGYRRWKVSDDSHFFPTRRVIIEYIETECDRGIRMGRFTKPGQPRENIRKIIVGDLERFRINNALTLNSLSVYFRKLIKENKEICIFENFDNWQVRAMTEEEKIHYCKRHHGPSEKTQVVEVKELPTSQRPNMIANQTFNNPLENPTTMKPKVSEPSSPTNNSVSSDDNNDSNDTPNEEEDTGN
ncbi:Glycolytic genes transcriptional activator GCR1 [Nakaseomyces bracarensis]|uniref:Glycolytic genes transcriptional activator GCR1 n=1 Tax=Nakaseomyces bracarensis TaxID=273131 RepID=A0ABR4NXZ4_9SACH